MEALFIIAVIILLFVYSYFFGGKAPKQYQERNCMGRQWKAKFPTIPKKDIRYFLLLFVDAFAFNGNQKLKFEPNDKILDIYISVTGNWGIDALELETLASHIEKEYFIQLNQVWHDDLTLGELFQLTLSAQQGAQPDAAKSAAPVI